MKLSDKKGMSYEDAGVNIEQGNELVKRIGNKVSSTFRPEVMGKLGSFAALFDISSLNYKQPVLVAGTDGVGTKIKLAINTGKHDTIGIDLVAMCVNDLIVQGAEPLFFLDYFACSKLEVDVAESVICGITEACNIARCSLIGGETAEMPGMYQEHDYDLAGFCVGAVEKTDIITGQLVENNDVLIAIASNGCHSNGYSLIRKILNDTNQDLSEKLNDIELIDLLLTPTRIYVKPILELIKKVKVKAISHITGGGLIENIPRVIPKHLSVQIDKNSWELPLIFQWLKEKGNIATNEMYKTFNCGIGMIICVGENDVEKTMLSLQEAGEKCWLVGKVGLAHEKKQRVNII